MKKIGLTVLSLALTACAVLAPACAKNGGDTPSNEEKTPRVYETGTYTLLDFDKESDLFSVRPYNADILDAYGKVSIAFDEQFVKNENPEKNGSLKYSYKGGKSPAIVLYPEKSAYPDMLFDNLLSFGINVYNSSENEKSVRLSVVSTTEEVYSVTEKLVSGWNAYELELDSVFVKYRIDDIYALCVEFEAGEDCDYYIDEWTATLGEKEYTEVQKNAAAFVEAVEETGDNVTANSAPALIRAFDNYGKLNEICKAAVEKYYDKWNEQITKYFEIISWSGEAGLEKEFLYFAKDIGVLQLERNEYATFSYAPDKTFGERKGGVKFNLGGNADKYSFGFITPSIVLGSYDYLSFAITNETDKEARFFFNDYADEAVIPAGETKEIEVPVKAVADSENSFTLRAAAGDIYISEVKAVALHRDEMYVGALKDEPFKAKSGFITFENGENRHVVKTTAARSEFSVEKEKNGINVAQSVSFSVKSNANNSLVLKDAGGNEIKEISVSPKARIVSLSQSEYDALATIAVSGKNAETEFSDFLLSREADEDYVSVLLLGDHVVRGENVTIKTFKEATYFLRTFENMVLYKQNYMKTHDEAAYEEMTARANAVTDIMRKMVEDLKVGKATEEECEILLGLSDTYTSLKTVGALDAESLKTLNAAKKGVLMNYKYNIFDFENPSAASLFTQDTDFYNCKWDVKAEVFDGRNVLAIDGTKPSKENYYYIHYDFSSSESVINEYDYVVWRIYNDSAWTRELFYIMRGWNYGMVYGKFVLPKGQWTEFTMSASDFANAGYMVLYEGSSGDKYYFDNVSAYSAQYVKAKIDALPEADKLTADDRKAVDEAKTAYDRLSTAGKAKVNAEKLNACVEKLSSLPYKFFDMSDADTLKRFSHPTDIPSYTWNGELSLTTEAEKGGVLALRTTGSTGRESCVYFGFNVTGIDLAGYNTVKFSVYNPKNVSLPLSIITRGWGKSYLDTSLKPEAWTEVTISVKDLLAAAWESGTGYINIHEIYKNEEVTLLFSDFVAYK